MFDAFGRFANGIISHESSNQGGGGGHQGSYRPPQNEANKEEGESALRLAPDSLKLSSSRSLRVSMLHAEKTHQAYDKARSS